MKDNIFSRLKTNVNNMRKKEKEKDMITFDDIMPLEEVDMNNFELNKQLSKQLYPFNGLWTFTGDINGLWNNKLYPTKEGAIQFGTIHCRTHNLPHFYIGRTEQPLDYGIDAKVILSVLRQNVLYLTNYQATYMEKVSEKAVHMLQESLLEVLNEWLREHKLQAGTFSVLPDTVEMYDNKGKLVQRFSSNV